MIVLWLDAVSVVGLRFGGCGWYLMDWVADGFAGIEGSVVVESVVEV